MTIFDLKVTNIVELTDKLQPMTEKFESKIFKEKNQISFASFSQQEQVALELIYKKLMLSSSLTQTGILKSIFKPLIEPIELAKNKMSLFIDLLQKEALRKS